ncbi:MAG: NYN domain-containing protein [Treponemataceae bacterium]|nr:NYN domain-containing protein [Treponemataceae bacterium]
MKRVTFYIDGFNFYYGLMTSCKKNPGWKKFYWIDMVKLCESFLGDGQELCKVIYFTASPLDREKSSRQSSFLNANRLLNGERFEVVRGKYIEKPVKCPLCGETFVRPEEKRTDVNISVRMVEDCVNDRTDTLVLVSADSDIIPPLESIKQNFAEKSIKVYFPPNRYSHDIKDFLTAHYRKKPTLLEKNAMRFDQAVMPHTVEKDGKKYTIPEKWIIS